ncbi:Hsp70 family protein [Saccharopolyspora taberi]|uniref:Hsp70 family protein n=1 Tax=Saccharopolyspora taberi TaxID=60895 RepID=A0ABN3VA46_9PSEU
MGDAATGHDADRSSDAVGMDLGTTYSVVAHVDDEGVPAVVPGDSDGPALVPSVVSFAGGTPVVGAAAKAAQAEGEIEVAALFKRSMGDPDFLQPLGDHDYTPTDLSALVLAELKARAERFLGRAVTRAVITVPAYFTHPQRTATIAAGRQAGLDVLKIISEPTAAALAYGLRPSPETRRVLVYDLGGGTFDVSLVEITPEELRVIGTGGDHQLGGRDWDDRLVVLLRQRFAREFGVDVQDEDNDALLVHAEQLKHALSARQDGEIRIESGGRSGRYSVTRQEFEACTRDLVERTRQLAQQVLDDAGLGWEQIEGVVPVGGSTRMPMVRECVRDMSGRPPLGGVHPDQAVALGAAIQARWERDSSGELLRLPASGTARSRVPRVMRDAIAHSLGMIAESEDRSRYVNSVLIRKNQPIPAQQRRPYQFRLRDDAENLLEIFLVQGETESPQECVYLGRYVVTGFSGSSGPAVVDISYSYDQNGVVHVSAVERATGTALELAVEEVPDDVPERFLGRPADDGAPGGVTIYLAFDLSGSMSGEPLEEAQRAAEAFVSQCDLSRISVGLIAFSDRVQLQQRATRDDGEIRAAIRALRVCQTGVGNRAHPFDEIRSLLAKTHDARYAVVLADGVWYCQDRAVESARRCHEDGIETIAIGFGSADRTFLERIASSSEQSLFTDLNRLTDAFSTIARELTENRRAGVRTQHLQVRDLEA